MLFDVSIGVVVVNGFKVLRFDGKPDNIRVIVQLLGYISHYIFHKHRVLVGPLGHILFILPLEHGIDITRGRLFYQLNEIFYPYKFS